MEDNAKLEIEVKKETSQDILREFEAKYKDGSIVPKYITQQYAERIMAAEKRRLANENA